LSAPPTDSSDVELAVAVGDGAAALGFPLRPEQTRALVAYLRLVARWNATYNLTAIRDPAAMVTHHLLDCLAAAVALQRRRAPDARRTILDVGSGAGLPGLVFAVAFPESKVVCVDSVGKKTAFVTQAAATLGLRNAVAMHARVETLASPRFDVIVSRAFASLHEFVRLTAQLLADNGEWMAMKARLTATEIETLRGLDVATEPISVPGLDAKRSIVWMRPHAA
jgi:16S rRNA (guanine527-N7)-methyltransferase